MMVHNVKNILPISSALVVDLAYQEQDMRIETLYDEDTHTTS
jgi:hypothetical protein